MKRRIVSALLLASMLFCGLAGCGSNNADKNDTAQEDSAVESDDSSDSEENAATEEKVTITVMYAGGDQNAKAATEEVTQNFMDINPNIEVKLEPSGSGSYDDFLKTKEAVGELGDVLELKNNKTFIEAGKIAEMPEEISSLIQSPIVLNGKVYAVPSATNTQGIIYNKKIFDNLGLKEPTTYQEFLDLCEKIKASGVDPLVVGASDLWHMGFLANCFFRNDVLSTNPDWVVQRNEGAVSWQDDEPTKMMQDLKDLFDAGYVQSGFMSTADSQTAAILTSETAAMLCSGPWMFAQLEAADPNFEYGFFFLPDENGEFHVFSDTGSGWAISKACEDDPAKFEAAKKFLTFYYTPENYVNIVSRLNVLPAIKEEITYDTSEVQKKLIETFQSSDTIKYTSQLGDINVPDGFRDYSYKTMQNVILGETSVKDAMASLEKEWQTKLEAQNQ